MVLRELVLDVDEPPVKAGLAGDLHQGGHQPGPSLGVREELPAEPLPPAELGDDCAHGPDAVPVRRGDPPERGRGDEVVREVDEEVDGRPEAEDVRRVGEPGGPGGEAVLQVSALQVVAKEGEGRRRTKRRGDGIEAVDVVAAVAPEDSSTSPPQSGRSGRTEVGRRPPREDGGEVVQPDRLPAAARIQRHSVKSTIVLGTS